MAKRRNTTRRRVYTKRSLPPARGYNTSRSRPSAKRWSSPLLTDPLSTVGLPPARRRRLRATRKLSYIKPISFVSRPRSLAGLRKLTSPTAISLFNEEPRKLPKRLAVCIGRKVRKEVLHAFGFAGKLGQRKPRFNSESKIKC